MATEASPTATAAGYRDFHRHIEDLDAAGLLVRLDRPINKDTELHPLVRWQFCGGIAEPQRRAFLFSDVRDGAGHGYDIRVAVGALAANRAIYGMAIGCDLAAINDAWRRATEAPRSPVEVSSAPCQEIVREGRELLEPFGGLDGLPVPISTPGWDNAPYLSAGHFITRDPDSGIQNVGNYRGQLKSRTRLGVMVLQTFDQGITPHWRKWKAREGRLPCAVVLGPPPAVSLAAVNKLPPDVDEVGVAGGLMGAAVPVVACRTVDILVPADAELVIEGYIDTAMLEPEGPFGESHGYVSPQEYNAFMEVTAITRRHDAILPSIISQVTPSESSMIKLLAYESAFLAHLRRIGVRGVESVSLHERLTNLRKVVVVRFSDRGDDANVWRALQAAASFQSAVGKLVMAVDADIDPTDADSLLWAISYRMDPRSDLELLGHRAWGHGPPPIADDGRDGAMLMDATLKKPYPPIALPRREFMDRARDIWEELGLPRLTPQPPWYGYSLGAWNDALEDEAQAAVRGRYWDNGEQAAARRRGDVAMNTPVDEAPEPAQG
jgi:UbiD family decarboxylase